MRTTLTLDDERWLREAQRLFSELSATGHAERLARELASR